METELQPFRQKKKKKRINEPDVLLASALLNVLHAEGCHFLLQII